MWWVLILESPPCNVDKRQSLFCRRGQRGEEVPPSGEHVGAPWWLQFLTILLRWELRGSPVSARLPF